MNIESREGDFEFIIIIVIVTSNVEMNLEIAASLCQSYGILLPNKYNWFPQMLAKLLEALVRAD